MSAAAGVVLSRPPGVALLLCALSLSGTLAVGAWAWTRRRATAAARSFAVIVFAEAAWAAGHLGELISPTLRAKVAWDAFETVPTVIVFVFMLMFAAAYTGRRLPRGLLAVVVLAVAPPTLVIAAAPLVGHLRASAHLDPPYGALVYDFTGWDLAYIAVGLVLGVGAIGTILAQLFRQPRAFRAQTLAVALALAFPFVLGFIWIALDLRLQGERDTSHVTFAAGAVIIGWALARERLFDLVPIARDAVVEHLTDALLVLDRIGRVVDANKVATVLFRKAASPLVSQPASQVLADWPEVTALVLANEPSQLEVPSPSGDDRRWYDARWTPLFDARGGQLGGTLVMRDLTTLRQARLILEQQVAKGSDDLALSEGRFRALFDQTFQMIGILDRAGVVLAANRAALDMAGTPPTDLIGRPFEDWPWWAKDPTERERVRAVLARAATGEFARFETTHVDSAGRQRYIDLSLTPVRDARGEIVQIIPEGRDITTLEEAHARATALAAELQQARKLEAIGRIASGVAHDFNNLLTVITGGVSLARRDLPPDAPAREMLDEALQAAEGAADITRQLLAFGRQQPIAPRILSLAEVLPQLAGILRRLAGASVKIEMRLPGELGRVNIDPAQLQQILVNLIVNARDAMPDGGTITLLTENVTVSGAAYVRLTIRDTGHGMTDEVRAHVFEPFFTTKPEGAGTGLGLAVVHGAVHQAGGFIEIESAPGRGTAFRLCLPSAASAAP